MNLDDIGKRQIPPEPWAEGDNIPWNDPGFSKRMLEEHLTQRHDLASRRFTTIDQQVGWINEEVLQGETTKILELTCGPGLYTSRLARLGHQCMGIDYAPAAGFVDAQFLPSLSGTPVDDESQSVNLAIIAKKP